MPIQISKLSKPDEFMMNENTVNEKVAEYLKRCGFHNVNLLSGNHPGIDVYGKKNGWEVWVESKGSRSNSAPSGEVFEGNQLWDHLCKQLGTVMKYKQADSGKRIIVAANPAISRIFSEVEKIFIGSFDLEINWCWVYPDRIEFIIHPKWQSVFNELEMPAKMNF